MSEYQVIARKWRPQCFGDVVGQEHVVRTLRNAISSGRIAHAYLFVGPRGIGKTTLARIFAKALNCEHPVNGEPCCECASCIELASERSLDVIEIDAASRNSTSDMRELAENALTRPVSGKYKIYIIDEVHMLSKAAWNVLLKTVEEPPAHVKFIFATTEVHQVLPTIISRCQRFDLMPIQTRLIAERLKLIADSEKVAIDPDAIDAIARAADGGMRDAQSLLDQMIAFFSAGNGSAITEAQVLSLFGLTDRGELNGIMRAILKNNPADVVTAVAKLARRGKNLETLFDDLLHVLRGIQLCTILADPAVLLDESAETINSYRELARSVPKDTIQILMENLAPVGRVLHDALNKQVYLETVLLKAMREAHAVRIGDILARLNQLRTAGELKFLEQLPIVEKNFTAHEERVKENAADESATVQEVEKQPEVHEEIAAEDNVSRLENAVSDDQPTVESPVELSPADPVQNEDAVSEEEAVVEPEEVETAEELLPAEPVQNEDAVSEEEAAVEPEEVETAEELHPAEPVQNEDAVSEEEFSADSEEEDDDESLDDAGDIDDIDREFENISAMPMTSSSSAQKDSLTPDRLQKSIANDNPQALIDIVHKDPVIEETVDLFSGLVIDIHR